MVAVTFTPTVAYETQMRRNETSDFSNIEFSLQICIPAARSRCNLAVFQVFSTQHINFLITSGLKLSHFKPHAFCSREPSGPSGIGLMGIWPVVFSLMKYLLQMLLFVSFLILVCA